MTLTETITWPFAQLLMAFYNFTLNYGIAIILFAVVLKLILLYPMMKSKQSMMRSARLQPYMKELEKKHEGNKQKYQEEVSKLYKEENINPMSGCLWSLIPMIILFMLYDVIRKPYTSLMHLSADQYAAVTDKVSSLGGTIPTGGYSQLSLVDFVHQHFDSFSGISNKLVDLDFSFLGMNLAVQPDWKFFLSTDWSQTSVWLPALGLFLIPVLSAVLSYFSMVISNKANPGMAQQQSQMKMMMYMMPLMSVYFGFIMPGALGVYWIANSVLAIIQDSVLNSYYGKQLDKEDAERRERLRAREIELEKKHLETEKLKALGATEINKNTSKKKIQATAKAASNERLAAERAEEKQPAAQRLGFQTIHPIRKSTVAAMQGAGLMFTTVFQTPKGQRKRQRRHRHFPISMKMSTANMTRTRVPATRHKYPN